ncbi:MAG: S24 family peptidase [Gammaproteobacteria bacterium]
MTTVALTLNDTLNRLLFERKIRPMELARQTNVPQATIQRLTAGVTTRPHRDTLEAIAAFFSISVEQLLGKEPIPGIPVSVPEELEPDYKRIPLLDSMGVVDLNRALLKEHQQIITDAPGGSRMFAMRITDNAMEPVFPENTLLIIDPDLTPRDRSFVVVRLSQHNEVVFRQLVTDGPDLFIKALSADFQKFEMKKIRENDVIIGVLVQTKRDYSQKI